MAKKNKIAVIGLAAAAVAVAAVYLLMDSGQWTVDSRQAASVLKDNRSLHFYDKRDISLKNIRLDLVYFVPKDAGADAVSAWQDVLRKAGNELKKFYEAQFEGLLRLNVQIYPKMIIGLSSTNHYNTFHTDNGNPNALLNIAAELDKRLYNKKGDLYKKEFDEIAGQFRALGIVYEGVGASGSGAHRTLLIAREFLTRPQIKEMHGPTFFAHEFGHTLGMPDFSHSTDDTKEAGEIIFTNDDIMGSGRYKPLANTYISNHIKLHMIYGENKR